MTISIECKLIGKSLNYKPGRLLLILDTGADRTSIRRTSLLKCGYTEFSLRDKPRRTIAGIHNFQTCVIDKLSIGGQYYHRELEVNVLDFDDDNYAESKISGVLGMDVLRKLTFIMSKEHKKALLTTDKILELDAIFSRENPKEG